MGIYISILRGINVSGQKNIKMAALKTLYESLGLKDVQTYIQSGNVVFTGHGADEETLASAIRVAIKQEFGYRIVVLVRSDHDWKSVATNNPFDGGSGIDPSKLQVTFLAETPGKSALDALNATDRSHAAIVRSKCAHTKRRVRKRLLLMASPPCGADRGAGRTAASHHRLCGHNAR